MSELATIRRAYRYIVAYERRVLDAISQIDEVARDADFERNQPQRWWPLYRNATSRDWAPDKSAWNSIPVYACRYRWMSGEHNVIGTRYLLLDHVADTDFEQQMLTTPNLELEPLDGLAAPEKSRSILRWFLIELTGPLTTQQWKDYWPDILAKQVSQPAVDLLLKAPTDSPRSYTGKSLRFTSACVDLETLDSPDSLKTLVLDPLRTALAQPA